MIQELAERLEKRRISSIAREYRNKGYRVIVQPQKQELPAFLADFEIDLLAQNGEDNVVIEVKTRSSLPKSSELPLIAGILDDKPGWRLELVVTNSKEKHLTDEGIEPLNRNEVVDRLNQVAELLLQSQNIAAMLLAWSAAEAALRLVAEQYEIALKEQSPEYIVKQLFSMGVLSRGQYDILQAGVQFRNTLVHGYKNGDVNPDTIHALVAVTTELVEAKI